MVWLLARGANVERAGAIGLAELVRQALRMRADRLVVGEFRGAEIVELLAALNTGHAGGAATVHANSVPDVPARLIALAALAGMSPSTLLAQAASALDVLVHVRRGPGRHPAGRPDRPVATPAGAAGAVGVDGGRRAGPRRGRVTKPPGYLWGDGAGAAAMTVTFLLIGAALGLSPPIRPGRQRLAAMVGSRLPDGHDSNRAVAFGSRSALRWLVISASVGVVAIIAVVAGALPAALVTGSAAAASVGWRQLATSVKLPPNKLGWPKSSRPLPPSMPPERRCRRRCRRWVPEPAHGSRR